MAWLKNGKISPHYSSKYTDLPTHRSTVSHPICNNPVHQILIQRAMNVWAIALASSTKPSSSRSCTLPLMPDSKAEETRERSAHSLSIDRDFNRGIHTPCMRVAVRKSVFMPWKLVVGLDIPCVLSDEDYLFASQCATHSGVGKPSVRCSQSWNKLACTIYACRWKAPASLRSQVGRETSIYDYIAPYIVPAPLRHGSRSLRWVHTVRAHLLSMKQTEDRSPRPYSSQHNAWASRIQIRARITDVADP